MVSFLQDDSYLRGVLFGIWLVLFGQFVLLLGVFAVLFDPSRSSVARVVSLDESSAAAEAASLRDDSDSNEFEAWPRGVVAFLEAALSSSVPSRDAPREASLLSREAARDAPRDGNREATRDARDATREVPRETTRDFEWDSVASDDSFAAEAPPWLNIVVARFFVALRDSRVFNERMCEKLNVRMNKKLDASKNMFVSHVRLHDIRLGDNVPKITSVKLLKGLTDDLAVALELDITYAGGASVGIEPTLTRGQPIPLRVSINSLRGKIRVRVPAIGYSDMLSASFLEDPGVSFRVDAPTVTVADNDLVRGMVSTVLSEIVRRMFLEMWVLPAFRTVFLPLMIPGVEEEMARMDEVNRNSKEAKSSSSGATSKIPGVDFYFAKARSQRNPDLFPPPAPRMPSNPATTTTTVTRTPSTSWSLSQSPSVKIYDWIESPQFPLSIVLDSNSSEKLESLQDAIVRPFLQLAREGAARKESPLVMGANGVSIATSDWRTVKTSTGVVIRKGVKKVEGGSAEFVLASVSINCDAERVFVMLSNPEHLRHVEPTYVDSVVVKQFDESCSIRQSTFKLGKPFPKTYTVFEVQKRIPAELRDPDPSADPNSPPPLDSFLIVRRSIGGYKDVESSTSILDLTSDPYPPEHFTPPSQTTHTIPRSRSPSPTKPRNQDPTFSSNPPSPAKPPIPEPLLDTLIPSTALPAPLLPPTRQSSLPPNTPVSTVYLQGYIVEHSTTHPTTQCTVTLLSQLSPDLQRLETNVSSCKKLKSFVEEYVLHVDGSGGGGDGKRNTPVLVDVMATKGQEIKNFLSATATTYLKGRKVKGWSGGAGGSVMGGGGSRLGEESGGRPAGGGESGDEEELSEYEDSTTEFVNVRARGMGGYDAVEQGTVLSRATSDAGTVGSGTSSHVAQSMKQGVDLVASMAKTMKRPSMGFLTRAAVVAAGGMSSQVEEEDSDSGSVVGRRSKSGSLAPMEPFSIGKPCDLVPFVNKSVIGRDIVKEEVVFRREVYPAAVELAWEFVLDPNQSIVFGLAFKPDAETSTSPHNMALLFPESVSEYGTRQLIPHSAITTGLVPTCRGTLCVSSFGSGTFSFVWDNMNGNKKQEKEFQFRFTFRLFEVPRPFGGSPQNSLVIGEFGFDAFGRGQHNTGMLGEVTISRKSLYRSCLVFDASMEGGGAGEEEGETVTYLTWDFSTNGLDVMFGINYYAVPEEANSGESLNSSWTNITPPDSTIPSTSAPPKPSRKPTTSTTPSSHPPSPAPTHAKLSLAERLEAAASKADHLSQTPPLPPTGTSSPSTHSREPSSRGYTRPVAIPVVPLTKVKTNVGTTASGTIAVPVDRGTGKGKKGVYAFVWDNTQSMMLPKVVSFRVGVVTTAVLGGGGREDVSGGG
ncbi:PDZ domain-containing protein 8, partial [Podochytrium sp. JEL0797]